MNVIVVETENLAIDIIVLSNRTLFNVVIRQKNEEKKIFKLKVE